MVKKFLYILTIIACISCKDKGDGQKMEDSPVSDKMNDEFNVLEANFNDWWTYHENNIVLASDFVALNAQSENITKDQFLQSLTTSEYIPLKLNSADSLNTYKLFKMSDSADNSIRSTIRNTSERIYKNFKMEGTNFAGFNFIDLKGKKYNNDNTKGKTLVFKCWFINCKPCVAEFPELNNLVERHKNMEDILFISLAMDSKSDLDKFLSTKSFKYETIPDQKKFMDETLDINQYPTHIIVNKDGIIEKVVNKSSELISFLEEGQILSNGNTKNLPPPPPAQGPAN